MYLRQIATELAEQYITQAKVVTPERYQTDTLVSMSFAKLKQAGIVKPLPHAQCQNWPTQQAVAIRVG